MSQKPVLRIVNIVLWVLVGAAVSVLGADYLAKNKGAADAQPVIANASEIGGPFDMVNTKGKTVTEKNFSGKPLMLFFGFTNCPAICPGTLGDMTLWLEKLGVNAEKIQAVFVSLDPERDTVERMAEYMQAFDPRITGLTGTPEQTARIAKAYKVFYKKMPPMHGGGYMVDHSASVYLFNAQGSLVSTIDANENRVMAFAKIEKLIR
jgi:protein SCO1/2